MNRKQFIRTGSFAAFALALSSGSGFAEIFTSAAFNIKMLSGNVGLFTERGGTILFVITKKGIVVVDSQFPETAKNFITEVGKQSKKSFALLINTHHHGDHSSGNIAFKGLVKNVLAHENSKKNQAAVAVKNNTEDKQLYPDMTYSHVWRRKMGRDRIAAHYFGAGHTNGDSFVAVTSQNIVHCGDLVFNRRHPVIDRAAGANIGSWIEVLQKATDFFPADTRYVCGHAREGLDVVISKADILLFREYLQNLMKLAREKRNSGMSKEEFLKLTDVPGSPEWKGGGTNRAFDAAWEEVGA